MITEGGSINVSTASSAKQETGIFKPSVSKQSPLFNLVKE